MKGVFIFNEESDHGLFRAEKSLNLIHCYGAWRNKVSVTRPARSRTGSHARIRRRAAPLCDDHHEVTENRQDAKQPGALGTTPRGERRRRTDGGLNAAALFDENNLIETCDLLNPALFGRAVRSDIERRSSGDAG
jgi:hypothetical protein